LLALRHTFSRFVAGLRLRLGNPGSTIFFVIILVALLAIFALVGPMILGNGATGRSDDKIDKIPQSSPAQQLLQAPQSTTSAQSPITASYNRSPAAPMASLGSGSPATLPPICPSLILPHTEARFMIPFESLERGNGALEIRGTSGRKLLHGTVQDTDGGRRSLQIASSGCEEDPRVTVIAPAREGGSDQKGSMGVLEIYGKGGKFYGTLEAAEDGGAVLRCAGQFVMSLEIAGGDDMRMTASSVDGRLLASAGNNVQGSRSQESSDTWKLQVKPNNDAVLIAACMLGVLLFSK